MKITININVQQYYRGNSMKRQFTLTLSILIIIILLSSSSFAVYENYKNSNIKANNKGFIDISVEEAWELLNDVSNGIQIPIDVRRNDEWNIYHIDTPIPENPRHFRLDLLQDEYGLNEFLNNYNGKDVIIYCKAGSRSATAANILVENNFSGIIYNMVGGILDWRSEDFPTNEGMFDNITALDSWILLNNTNNCIQIPIDVRTDMEWADEHIDTPKPENPILHCLCAWENISVVQEFISTYNFKEIILYCKSGMRSESAANILIDNNFIGTIYNMDGGIDSWKDEGLPTIPNFPPEKPNIIGPSSGEPNIEYNFTISSDDPECDNIIFCINWSDNTNIIEIGTYESGENITISHIWNETGTYIIKIKSIDCFQAESEWSTLELILPKNKNINLINQFFEDHFYIFSFFKNLIK